MRSFAPQVSRQAGPAAQPSCPAPALRSVRTAARGHASGVGESAEAARHEPRTTPNLPFLHDFGRITIHAAPPAIQPKLRIGASGDADEREAEQVAEQVMRMPEPHLQPGRRPSYGGGDVEAPAVHDVLRSPGHPLDAATRAFMEPRFGHDFSRVRVHTDARAADFARAIGARAFAMNDNIVLGAGEYLPETDAGRWLLAHELTHVVQQGRAGGSGLQGSGPVLRRQALGLAKPGAGALKHVPDALAVVEPTVVEIDKGWQRVLDRVAAIRKVRGLDLMATAQEVHDAMAGAGTNEDEVYAGLAKLEQYPELIKLFRLVYLKKYGVDVVAEIKSDFSDFFSGGLELTRALGYLNIKTLPGMAAKILAETLPHVANNPILQGKEHPAYRIGRVYSGHLVGKGFSGFVQFSESGAMSQITGPEDLGGKLEFSDEEAKMVVDDARRFPEVQIAMDQLQSYLEPMKNRRSTLAVSASDLKDADGKSAGMILGRNLGSEGKAAYVKDFSKDVVGRNVTRALFGSFDMHYNVIQVDPTGDWVEVTFTLVNRLTLSSFTRKPPKDGKYGPSLIKDKPGQSIDMSISFKEKIYFKSAAKKILG